LDSVDELQAGADGALGIVLAGDRSAPDGHDRVTDELLDGPAVAGHHLGGEIEIARERVAHVLHVAPLGEGGEADQIGEEDADEATFGDGGRGGVSWPSHPCQRGRALATEFRRGRVGRAAVRAASRKWRRALGTELALRLVLGSAVRADHQGRSHTTLEA
jgi:hypothetical protein